MKKKDLEIILEKIPSFNDPNPALEQYPTPATIAADILFYAYRHGDIEGLKIADLGCGTGMFSIGAWILGAGMSIGYDISESALISAKECARSMNVEAEFVQSDVKNIKDGADTVFMNPPFGCQKRNADRTFLDKAMEISECVYSVHMADTLDFIKEYANIKGRNVTYNKMYKYDIPHTFEFHKKIKQTVEIVAVNIR